MVIVRNGRPIHGSFSFESYPLPVADHIGDKNNVIFPYQESATLSPLKKSESIDISGQTWVINVLHLVNEVVTATHLLCHWFHLRVLTPA